MAADYQKIDPTKAHDPNSDHVNEHKLGEARVETPSPSTHAL